MKATVEVKDRAEAAHIREALDDPAIRAFVITVGALKALPSDRARKRVLQFVMDKLDEERRP